MSESFERGFLGIVEPFFGIGEGKFRGIISACLLMGWVMPHCGHGLFGLAELGYGDAEHRESHGGHHGQG